MKAGAGWIGGMFVFVLALGRCAALPACAEVALRASVEVADGTFTLADLLGGRVCRGMREAAAQVSLGVAPRAGSTRMFDGQQVRALVESLASDKFDGQSVAKPAITMQIPERVVVRRAEVMKTCGEIAKSLASSALWQEADGNAVQLRQHLDCAAASGVPEEAELELVRANRNEALQRWEFLLRCTKPEACVPFMVWAHEDEPQAEGAAHRRELGLGAPL